MIKLAVAGAAGRSGRAVVECAARDDAVGIVQLLGPPDCGKRCDTLDVGHSVLPVVAELQKTCDVLVDVSVPEGTAHWAGVCADSGIAFVTGVTGHDADQVEAIHAAAKRVPVLRAPNFSVGISAIAAAVVRLVRELGPDFDVEIVETHHRTKIDAPSGTALSLADTIERARNQQEPSRAMGRSGKTGVKPAGQIGIHAIRSGTAMGAHEIRFGGPGETVTISHAAHSRDAYGLGALRAAKWLVGKAPGMYTMRDVLHQQFEK